MHEERVEERTETGRPAGPRGGPPWVWLALLATGVVAALIVFLAAALDDDDADEAVAPTTETVETVETVETQTVETETVETVTTMDADGEDAPTVAAPDLVGLDHAAAGREAEEVGLVADTYPVPSDAPRGQVVEQSPAPGTEVATTRHLRLNVSVGPGERPSARVPDVTGPDAPRAREIVRDLDFTVRTADRDAPTAEEVGEVILQEPAAGTTRPVLTQVTLYVGR